MLHDRIKNVMTRALTMFLVLALPILADEKKTTTTDTTAASTTAATSSAAAQPQAQPDSPLVAAAKRANRLGKKPTNVITNATLKTSGTTAHVTTTEKQSAIQMPKPGAA